MKKLIRILEVPFYLLVISLVCFENGSISIAIFLLFVSIVRLIANEMTDQAIYRK